MKDIAKKLGKGFILMGGVLVQVLAAAGNVFYLTFDFVGEAFHSASQWLGIKGEGLMEKGQCETEHAPQAKTE